MTLHLGKIAQFVFLGISSIMLLSSFLDTSMKGPKDVVELGEMLFFEKALSRDYSISCASCHQPGFAFADTVAFSVGVGGKLGLRNTPSIMNMASRSIMFYDGRAASLEAQVRFPIEDKNEMDISFEEVIVRLNNHDAYPQYFQNVFGQKPTVENVSKALAEFQRSLETADTPFDDYMNDIPPMMSEAAIRGRAVFMSEKAKCFDCHFSPDFTGDEFKNIGLYDEKTFLDKGRFEVTKDKNDLGKFKVPGLRNVAVTPPYMHNGMFKTLREVIDYYDNPRKTVKSPINLDPLLNNPLGLTEQEKDDLEVFLWALTDKTVLAKYTRERKDHHPEPRMN